MTGTWIAWSKQAPPANTVCKFENGYTGQIWVGKPEDIPPAWDTRMTMWKLVAVSREEKAHG